MPAPEPSALDELSIRARRLTQGVVALAYTRVELLTLELQEERERLVRAALLALGSAVFCLLAGIAFTVALLVWLWETSPLLAALALTGVYSVTGLVLHARLKKLLRDWQAFPGTLGELQKDRERLDTWLS